MALPEFLQVIRRATVEKRKSLVAIGDRYGWNFDDALEILLGEATPTDSQLQIIAKELDLPEDSMRAMLER